jgi:uncharacterized protein involved in exopolysaccharide biosynthesis
MVAVAERPAAEQRDDDIDLRAVVATLWARRWWIAMIAVLFTIPFAISAFLAEPLYRAATVVADARSDATGSNSLTAALGALGNLGNVARLNIQGATYSDEAIAVLRSREFTERFIAEHDIKPQLFPEIWDARTRQWLAPEPTLSQAYRVFNAIRSVTQAGRGGLVTVAIEWRDPVQAAEWANAVVAQLNAEMRERAIASTKLSVSYLEKELATTSTIDTRQAINRLMEAQINQRMLANVTAEYAFRIVERALPPDPDDSVGPSKLVLLALGPTLGVVFGIFVVLAVNIFVSRRSARAPA